MNTAAWAAFLLIVALPLAALAPLLPDPACLAAARESLPIWGRTAALAGLAALTSALLAVPVGWTLARRDARGLLLGLTLGLAVLPTTLAAIGWIACLGFQGTVATWPSLYGPPGVALVWALVMWPLPALSLAAALKRTPRREEEAALLGLGPWRTALRLSLPRAAGALLAGTLCAWILMLGDLGVPGCLQVPLGAEAVHARFAATWDGAGALGASLPMLALAVAALLAVRGRFAMADHASEPGEATGMAGPGRAFAVSAWTVAAVSWLAPAGALAAWARSGGGGAVGILASEGLTSLALGGAAGLIAALTAFALAASLRPPVLAALAGVAVLAFALPGTLTGAGLIRFWNAPGLRGEAYASPAVLLLGLAARAFAPALLAAWIAIRAIPASAEDAGRLAGLSPATRAFRITLPMARAGLLAGALAAAAVAAGEVAIPALVAPPGIQTLSVRLFSLIHFGADGVVGAAALMALGAVFVLGLGASALLRRA